MFSRGRFLIVAAFLLFVSVIAFSCFYLLAGYPHLVEWYVNLNNCFYHSNTWSTDFFTPRIKSDGNMYCIIALVIASAGLIYVPRSVRTWNEDKQPPAVSSRETGDTLPVILCLAVAIAAWVWGNKLTLPAYDEVFSALHVAGIHPFQAVSYYMLPNNHLFFNLLNDVLFHWVTDKVATGRVISLMAYCILILSLFFGFKRMVRNRWLALLISATLALQFHVWGFSFQARGYELYLLAEWGMVLSLFSYVQSSKTYWLYINMLCIAFGYFCLPSFLYLHVAQVAFMLLYQLFYKKKETAFWKYQLAAVLLAYLFYLPALCFSGLDAIAHNTYVAPMVGCKTTNEFIQFMWPNFQLFITHLFSDIHRNNISFNMVLFLLPVSLLFGRKNKANVLFGMFYLVMWVVFLLVIIAMNRLPFERNLIGQYSITLAGITWWAYWATGLQGSKERFTIVKRILFCSVLLFFAVHFIRTNEASLKTGLYEFDANAPYIDLNNKLRIIPQGSTVAFSDESFYCYYICGKQGDKVNKCTPENEDYYIKQAFEHLPQSMENKDTMILSDGQYEIYKRR